MTHSKTLWWQGLPARAWAPVAVFLLLWAAAQFAGRGGDGGAWADQAVRLAQEAQSKGLRFFDLLSPEADPRLGAALVLARLGVPAAGLRLVMQLLAALVVSGGLLFLGRARTRERGDGLGAFLVAVSPVTLLAALRADPHLGLGLAFLLLLRDGAPRWLQILLLSWGLSWSPWAWAGLLVIPLGSLLSARGHRSRGPIVMLLAAMLMWFLNPMALLHPIAWFQGMLQEARLSGLLGGDTLMGLRPGWWPAEGSLHWAGLVLLLGGALSWPGRMRAGNLRPLVLIVLALLGMRGGFVGDVPQLILLPWAAGEIGRFVGVAGGWVLRQRGNRATATVVQVLLVLIPMVFLLRVGAQRIPMPEAGIEPEQDVAAWLEAELEPGSRVLHDAGFTPPASSRLVYLPLPYHAVEPERYRGAYWRGWFQSFRAFVASERLVVRYLREERNSPSVIRFYAERTGEARTERTFGTQAGRRTRVLLFTPDPDLAFADGWRHRIAGGQASGLPGEFLAGLGASLVRSERPGAAAELLEEAISAGYRDLGVYINLANAQLALERTFEAGRVLDEARRHHPESIELQYNLGMVLVRAKLWDRALRTLLRVQQAWPRSASVAYLIGLTLANEGRLEAAREQLTRALDLGLAGAEREHAAQLLQTAGGQVGE